VRRCHFLDIPETTLHLLENTHTKIYTYRRIYDNLYIYRYTDNIYTHVYIRTCIRILIYICPDSLDSGLFRPQALCPSYLPEGACSVMCIHEQVMLLAHVNATSHTNAFFMRHTFLRGWCVYCCELVWQCTSHHLAAVTFAAMRAE